jgi:kinesin family protein 1
MASTEHHDVLASIEVHEMGNDGEYKPADVEDDVAQLHLGVQRQMVVSLKHASGQAFKWTRIVHASASHVRVQNKEHAPVEVPASSVDLQLVSHVEYASDGTSRLLARGTWDSAAHHCIHLDRRSRGDDLAIVRLTFMVDVERLDEPAVFTMDLKVKIIGRDSRRSSISIRNIWRPRPVTSVVGIFGVDLNPPLARTARDLWRLDTSKKPVANEAVLGGWRPRSIALVREYNDLARVRRALAEVQTTRVVLEHVGDLAASQSDETGQRALEAKSLSLWKREMDTRVEFDVKRETPAEKEMAQRLRELVPDMEPRLVPTVRLIPPK